jgi:hypothetical protein
VVYLYILPDFWLSHHPLFYFGLLGKYQKLYFVGQAQPHPLVLNYFILVVLIQGINLDQYFLAIETYPRLA